MPIKDLRENPQLWYKKQHKGIGMGRVQHQQYGMTVAGLLDVSVMCNVTAFSGGLNEVNNAWSLMMHVSEGDLPRMLHDTTTVNVRPSAGDSLFVFLQPLDTKSPGFAAFRENMISFASNFGGDYVGKATAAVTSNAGGGILAGFQAMLNLRGLDIRCVPGKAYDNAGKVDPKAFWKAPPQIAFLWQNPTLGEVTQGLIDYIQRYGVPTGKRYVTVAVNREMPRRQFLLTGGKSRVPQVGLEAIRDDMLMLAEWALT